MSQTSSPRAVTSLPAGIWTLCTGSTAEFTARNFGFKKVSGTIPLVHAQVDVDEPGRIARAVVAADLTAIDTGNTKRDTDLAKPHLLDSKQFPTLTFDSNSSAQESGALRGRLSAKGHSVDVEVSFTVESDGSQRLSVAGSATFDRADLGIKVPSFVIGRRIDVQIRAVFERVS